MSIIFLKSFDINEIEKATVNNDCLDIGLLGPMDQLKTVIYMLCNFNKDEEFAKSLIENIFKNKNINLSDISEEKLMELVEENLESIKINRKLDDKSLYQKQTSSESNPGVQIFELAYDLLSVSKQQVVKADYRKYEYKYKSRRKV